MNTTQESTGLKKTKIGVIGWGGRGGHCANSAYEGTNGAMVATACVDPDKPRYEMACETHQQRPTLYDDIESMIANEDLDGIIIATPNEHHLDCLKKASVAGIPILLEKPLECSYDQIIEVVRFEAHCTAPVMVGHCMRFAPIIRKAKELIDSGKLGNIVHARFVQNCFYGNIGYHNWRGNKEQSGTWLIEKATHDFDVMLALLGSVPKKVVCLSSLRAFGGTRDNDLHCKNCDEALDCNESMGNIFAKLGMYSAEGNYGGRNDRCVYAKEVTTPDNDHCLLEFDDGVIATYEQNFFSPRGYRGRVYEIMGDKGAMEIDLGEIETGGTIGFWDRYGLPKDKETYTFDYEKQGHYNGDRPMGKHFYDIIHENAEPETTIAQAFLAESIGYAAVQSAEQGTFVSVKELLPDGLSDLCATSPYLRMGQTL